MTTQDIANLVPLGMSLALVDYNLPKGRGHPVKSDSLMKKGFTNIVGLSLIKGTAQMAGSL